MSRLLVRASLRHVARHPWQFGLAVLGIALGVAVAVAVDLASESARRAFALATEAVTGRATHQIVGGPSGVPEEVYRLVRLDLGVRRAAPVVAADVAAPALPGRAFHLFGIDPFAEEPFRPHLAGAGGPAGAEPRRGRPAALADLVARPGTGLVSSRTARALGLRLGEPLAVRVSGRREAITLVGWLEPRDELSARALESLLVTDIATAQEVLRAAGRLTRIDLIVDAGAAGEALLERIQRALPPGVAVVPAGARAEAVAQMTRAFSLNLQALSLLALVVGMFLIYNTMTFSVVQRRTLIGTLRALGVTRREVFVLVIAEALVVGALGTGAGLLLGVALAQGLLRLVTQTINDLFFVLSVRDVWVTPGTLALGAALGIGATVAAALAPALEATGPRPRAILIRSSLEARARRAVPRAALAGAALLLLGGALLRVPGGGAGLGFVALFCLLMGAALMTPGAAVMLVGALGPAVEGALGVLGRLAARGVVRALSRTGVATAALMVAVATTVGVGVMIGSFRGAVVDWLDGTLRADVYVSPPSLISNRPDATLDPATVARLSAAPGVASASTSRGVVVPSPAGPTQVVALALDAGRRPRFRLRQGAPEAVWRAFDEGAVIVTEPYASRHAVGAGGTVRLRTDRGERAFRVSGVVYDYGSSAGAVLMHRRVYERLWDDRGVSSLALEAAPAVPVATLIETLRARAAGGPEVIIRSNRALREASLEVFDRTFTITSVLRLLTVVVAFIGVLSALLAQALERAREIAVLRALGLTPAQVWGLVTAQTGLVGLVAGILALPVGLMLATVLIHVINQRSFGWTMPVAVSPIVLVQGLALAVAAAVLAGLYPARQMAEASPAEALREE